MSINKHRSLTKLPILFLLRFHIEEMNFDKEMTLCLLGMKNPDVNDGKKTSAQEKDSEKKFNLLSDVCVCVEMTYIEMKKPHTVQ